jgi:hypothetical protein
VLHDRPACVGREAAQAEGDEPRDGELVGDVRGPEEEAVVDEQVRLGLHARERGGERRAERGYDGEEVHEVGRGWELVHALRGVVIGAGGEGELDDGGGGDAGEARADEG